MTNMHFRQDKVVAMESVEWEREGQGAGRPASVLLLQALNTLCQQDHAPVIFISLTVPKQHSWITRFAKEWIYEWMGKRRWEDEVYRKAYFGTENNNKCYADDSNKKTIIFRSLQ